MKSEDFNLKDFTGKNRRLLHEWKKLTDLSKYDNEIEITPISFNSFNLPIAYTVRYSVKSISGVEEINDLGLRDIINKPIFADKFLMRIELPHNFPAIDSSPRFQFIDRYENEEYDMPWHPNIRYFGILKGFVCLNRTDSFTDLAYAVIRVKEYLKYELFHAEETPPFPEDLKVAKWVREQGIPNGWISF